MKAVAILQQISETQPKGLAILDPVKDLKMSGLGYIELRDEKEMVEDTMLCYSCIKCPKFNEHVSYLYIILMSHGILKYFTEPKYIDCPVNVITKKSFLITHAYIYIYIYTYIYAIAITPA